MQNYTGAAPNRSYVAEFTIASGEANTDVVKSVTFQMDQAGSWPIDNGGGSYLLITLVAGTSGQTPAGVWTAGNFCGTANQLNFAGTVTNIFELFDVSFTEGTVAPAFQAPDYASEILACKRYFQMVGVSANVWHGDGNAYAWPFPLDVPMRASPTLDASGVTQGGNVGGYPTYQVANNALFQVTTASSSPQITAVNGFVKLSARI
jgi:hypothetical protein